MKIIIRKALIMLLALVLFTGIFASAMEAPQSGVNATIVFTHDMHSHFLPDKTESGGQSGGFAQIATAIAGQRAKADSPLLLVDGGDFSMGTLFQTAFSEQASELRALGMMGFDVTTFGNHEFDYRGEGLAQMLLSAKSIADSSGLELPLILEANFKPPQSGEEGYNSTSQSIQDALDEYGVLEYTVIEKEGVRFAVFGLMGKDADECAPMSGMILEPAIDAAKRIVAEIQAKEEYDFIVCLSHSGTWEKESQSEDEQLAKAVSGIDVIISGHTHTTLNEPIIINDTIIASCGAYTRNLGVINLSKNASGKVELTGYELIAIDESFAPDPEMEAYTQEIKDSIGEGYLKDYGMTFDQVLATSPFSFSAVAGRDDKQKEDTLGNLISDSYIYAVQQAEGENYVPIDMAVVADGVIRGTFPAGPITVSDAFNVSSLGIGADGTPGYPLISVYITGRELRDAFEVDASVTPIMSSAQLYSSGVRYSFNTSRIIFNKVTDFVQILPDGTELPIENDKLYRIVTGLYSGQMLGAVKGKSFGILSITPKDENGVPVEDFEARIIYDADGNEVKEWYALASYLAYLEEIPASYSAPEGRKIITSSMNPVQLLKNPNWVTLVVLAIILLLLALIVLIVVKVVRRIRRKKAAAQK